MARNLEGSIYKAADGKRWFARLRYTDADGKRREKKRTCISHAAAKAEIKNLQTEIADDARERKTYRQLDKFFRDNYVHAAKFVGGQKVSGFRQRTDVIEYYLDELLAHFADTPLDAITYADLQNHKAEIAATPKRYGGTRSVTSTNHFLKWLRRLFNVAIEQGWLDVNPFKRGSPLIKESHETERTRTLSPKEETRLLANCQGRRAYLQPLIIFAVETAMRRGEIQTLRWPDVDLKARVIKVAGANTKTLKSRMVPISQRLRETLAQLRQNQLRPNSFVFGTVDFKKAFAAACDDAKLPGLHFHDLRHTGITRMLEKGISPPLVMKISGHTQQKTFLRYVNQSEASILEIAKQLDRAAA